jgi:hypothetical protein
MDEGLANTVLQGRLTNGQKTQEKMVVSTVIREMLA